MPPPPPPPRAAAPPPDAVVAAHTAALRRASSSATRVFHLLSRSAALLSAPPTAPPAAAAAARDAAAAAQLAPSLPAVWAALLAAHLAAADTLAAATALDEGLTRCPHDLALRLARDALDPLHRQSRRDGRRQEEDHEEGHEELEDDEHPLEPSLSTDCILPSRSAPARAAAPVPAPATATATATATALPAVPAAAPAATSAPVPIRALQRPILTAPLPDTAPPTAALPTAAIAAAPVPPSTTTTTAPAPPTAETDPLHHQRAPSSLGTLPSAPPESSHLTPEPASLPTMSAPHPPYARQHPHQPPDPHPSQSPQQPDQALLAAADRSLSLNAYAHAIANYTTIIRRAQRAHPTPTLLRALRGRSTAWLRSAHHAADDPACFAHAAADAHRLVDLCPAWDHAWLCLGLAHLENGCPARAAHAFRNGLATCPSSVPLAEGLRDAELVIQAEGPESDWEDDSVPSITAISTDDDSGFLDALDGSEPHRRDNRGRHEPIPTTQWTDCVDDTPSPVVENASASAAAAPVDLAAVAPEVAPAGGTFGNVEAQPVLDHASAVATERRRRAELHARVIDRGMDMDRYRERGPMADHDRQRESERDAKVHAPSARRLQEHEAASPREAMQREAMQREAMQREAMQREAMQREAMQREAIQREAIQREAMQQEAMQREAVQQEAMQQEAMQRETSSRREAHESLARGRNDRGPEDPYRNQRRPDDRGRRDRPREQHREDQREMPRTRSQQRQQFQRWYEDEPGSSAAIGSDHQRLYDLLQVPRTATEASIKRSYYNLARKYHPDKNRNDAQAKDKFQQLAEAYRVLSDPESRAVYDKYGDKGLVKNSVDMIDPSTLFAMVFGSDQFVNLIGELQLASLATNVDENGNTPTNVNLNSIQKARVGKLALEMVKILKPWVDGDKKGFLSDIHRQMRRLKEASFGPSLLHTVGNVYVQQTTYLLDKSKPFKQFSAMMRKASLRSHRIASQHKAMAAAGRVMEKQRKLHDRVMRSGRDSRSISEEEAKEIAVEMAQNAIDMMWKISVIDIESTLEDVLNIVLSGRDLVADGELNASGSTPAASPEDVEKSRPWLRIGSHLTRDRDKEPRSDRSREASEKPDVGFVRPGPPLQHGEKAMTRQEILSERAYGIQAMGRIFASALR